MRLGSGPSIDPIAVVVLLLVAAATGYVMIQTLDAARAEPELTDQRQTARAYCYQAFGNPDVYTAAVVNGHGGYHCVANQGSPHYHETTKEARLAALEANRTGGRVDWATVDRYKSTGLIPEWLA